MTLYSTLPNSTLVHIRVRKFTFLYRERSDPRNTLKNSLGDRNNSRCEPFRCLCVFYIHSNAVLCFFCAREHNVFATLPSPLPQKNSDLSQNMTNDANLCKIATTAMLEVYHAALNSVASLHHMYCNRCPSFSYRFSLIACWICISSHSYSLSMTTSLDIMLVDVASDAELLCAGINVHQAKQCNVLFSEQHS